MKEEILAIEELILPGIPLQSYEAVTSQEQVYR